MLKTKPTKHLTGVTIQGDFKDFYDLVDSIYSITRLEEEQKELHYGVKCRLLGICYDIRHAFMGDREIILEDNGMDLEKMKWHKTVTPTKNVYYSVNVLFPEAIFVAAAVPQMYVFSLCYYGSKGQHAQINLPLIPYANYLRDKANLNVLCAGIWQALGEVIGDRELEKIVQLLQKNNESYINYATHYIDKCNIELLKADVDKRKDKLKSIAKRIVKKPQAYYNMEDDLKYLAKEYNTNIYDLEDLKHEYPKEVEW